VERDNRISMLSVVGDLGSLVALPDDQVVIGGCDPRSRRGSVLRAPLTDV